MLSVCMVRGPPGSTPGRAGEGTTVCGTSFRSTQTPRPSRTIDPGPHRGPGGRAH
ncbi:hypothetical protein F751_6664 [Auxenochlorella protothecoides]|uniref:Uncharacterized protein n=1 Tax=Auxenochlorella protothecoides TaxID=3075 RepID=A0A087SLV3_AUXPR|nr:hypothetical protein F751_6664 [Auxenochlorella protothecoides]KFM26707.1 hypothetical protein F751_6664 [Auxenochlorella protothecoides]